MQLSLENGPVHLRIEFLDPKSLDKLEEQLVAPAKCVLGPYHSQHRSSQNLNRNVN
jgi:hypothetical protein